MQRLEFLYPFVLFLLIQITCGCRTSYKLELFLPKNKEEEEFTGREKNPKDK